jgi:hypothetical protein
MLEPYVDIRNLGTFLSALASIANVIVIAVVAVMAKQKFRQYEQQQAISQNRQSLNPTLSIEKLPGERAAETILALVVKLENLGKVVAQINLEESNFIIEQLHQTEYDPADLIEEKEGKKYLKPTTRLRTVFAPFRIRLGEGQGICEVGPGAVLSFASCVPVLAGIYRLSAELALTEDATREFTSSSGMPLPMGQKHAYWIVSSIVDCRASAGAKAT